MDDGWFKQPHLESDWTLGLGEAAHLLSIELNAHSLKQPSPHTHRSHRPVSGYGGAQGKPPRLRVAINLATHCIKVCPTPPEALSQIGQTQNHT